MFFGFMLYLQWEAMLISYLATRNTVLPFDSLQSMLDNTDFALTMKHGSAQLDSFKTSKDPLWQKIWKDRIEPHVDFMTSYAGNIISTVGQFDQIQKIWIIIDFVINEPTFFSPNIYSIVYPRIM